MTSEGLGEMSEGDSADTCAGKFPLVSMGGRAEGLACADPEARTLIGSISLVVVLATVVKIPEGVVVGVFRFFVVVCF
jgi:hypothetical protein